MARFLFVEESLDLEDTKMALVVWTIVTLYHTYSLPKSNDYHAGSSFHPEEESFRKLDISAQLSKMSQSVKDWKFF